MKKATYQRSELPFQDFDDRLLVVHPENREVHLLEEPASTLWKHLEKPIEVERLIANVCDEFDVESGQAEKDVHQFLKELQSKGLLRS